MVEKRKLILYFLFFSKIAPRWGQIGQSYLALGRAKLRKSSKVEFIGANSDFWGVEMVPVPPVLAQIVQNEPWWAKLALEKLGPIWLLGSIWVFFILQCSLSEKNILKLWVPGFHFVHCKVISSRFWFAVTKRNNDPFFFLLLTVIQEKYFS